MSTAVSPAPARRRARQTLRDMLLSLTVILAIVGVVVALQQRGGRGLTVVDPAPALARAGAVFPVRTPVLPAGWRATSARTERSGGGHLIVRVGWITPKRQYAALVESDQPRGELLGRELSPGARPTGTVTIAGTPWQRLPAPQKGDHALVATRGQVTFVVSGSAGRAELEQLAGSLR